MQASPPVEPSLQMTPISGIGPQASAPVHGLVLRGGAQVVVQRQGPSFSLPHWLPLKVVPGAQTSAPGSLPHWLLGHWRYETVPSGSESCHSQALPAGSHFSLSDGWLPQADEVHGAV
jgi:hypothetical protein